MNSTPGELYILGIIISTLLSILGSGNLILNWKENKYFGVLCLFFAGICWQVMLYLSCQNVTFDGIQYNMSPFIPVLSEIVKTSIEYLLLGGIVAGLVLFVWNRKDCLEKLQYGINQIKSKYINKNEVEVIKEEHTPIKKTRRVIKKSVVNPEVKGERVIKKVIKKGE